MKTKTIDAKQSATVYFNGQQVQRIDDVDNGQFVVKFRKQDGSEKVVHGKFRWLNSIRKMFADRKADIQWLYVWYSTEWDRYRWRYTRYGGWKRCRYSGIRNTK